jgi:hypothetical protein
MRIRGHPMIVEGNTVRAGDTKSINAVPAGRRNW